MRYSAVLSGDHILVGIWAEVLDETVVALGVSGFACLPSESYQEHVGVLPSVGGRVFLEGFPDFVVWGFRGGNPQAFRYPEYVSIHRDDGAPSDEH